GSCIPWDDKVSVSINVTADPAAAKMNQEELFAGKNIALVFSGPGVDSGNGSNDPIEQKSTIVLPDYDVQEVSGKSATTSAWVNLLMALIAGMLLNLMPCVLPVIPLKVLSLLQQGQAARESGDKYKAVKLSLVFSAGILIVFVALAIIMSGFQMLYGQQFQSSGFKFVMLMIIFTLGLSMLGLFEVVLPGRMTNINIVKQGYIGALGMGVLATLLATPCSAPLLGPVLAWSLNQPTVITVAVFIVVGIGMSLPYLLLTAFPKMLDRLPKPGMWMIRLKEGLGFVMLAVAGYLVFLFPPEWHWPLVGFCIVLAFALWLAMKVVNAASPVGKRGIVRIVAMVLVAGAGWYVLDATKPKEHTEFSLARFVALQNEGKNIMVEFTADWCPNCKYVEKTVLKSKEFQDRLLKNDIIFMVADWTQKEPQITQLLNKLGSKSIPFAAVFDGDEPTKPVALRDIYTLETALKALDSVKE
ncbi:MAG: thioredoxin family protein, partial [Phycisphaerae bacterium]|nr:thioredoxin family protein [Phycisphaerae bacterium]